MVREIAAHILTSRLGRRIVLLFVLCALAPMVAVAGFSLAQNNAQLDHQMVRWLHQETKARGMALFERLSLLNRELEICVQLIRLHPDEEDFRARLQQDALRERFRSLFLVKSATAASIFGNAAPPRTLTPEELAHMAGGKSVLLTNTNEKQESRVFLARFLVPAEPGAGVLWAEVNAPFILGLSEAGGYGENMQLLLVDHEGRLLHAEGEGGFVAQQQLKSEMQLKSAGEFRWTTGNQRYIAYSWPLYLKTEFQAPFLAVIYSVPEKDVFALPYTMKSMLLPVFALTILAIILLSLVQVRRNLQPLKALTDGTKRIADKEFDTRVKVASKDEFGELASSFNDMAMHLESQFKALTAISEIDRAVLSSLKREEIVETVLNQMQQALGFDLVGLTLLEQGTEKNVKTFMAGVDGGRRLITDTLSPFPPGLFDNCSERLLSLQRDDHRLPGFLREESNNDLENFFLLPISCRKNQPDVLILGRRNGQAQKAEIASHARSIADQVGVALVNASLLEELQDMSWGALQALARAVDAKSSWTAGHSERVTFYALKLGRILNLNDAELETLHRGALLHDIGKIGVAGALLDKDGSLSADEFVMIKMHPSLGGQILEPIKTYTSVLNIVVQHHERFDGNGYPFGLSGGEIDFGARILAVADVFDAVSSDRPYRKGWSLENCIELIRDGRGLSFDPMVVDGFLDLISREGERILVRAELGDKMA